MQELMLLVMVVLVACGEGNDRTRTTRRKVPPKDTVAYEQLNSGKYNDAGYFSSQDGRFMVDFPGRPEHSSDLVDTDVGKVRSHSFIHSPSATEAFMVFYADYPSDYVRSIKPDEMLGKALAGAMKPLGVEGVEDSEQFTLNGMPALDFRTQGEALHMVGRIILDGNRLFQITIIRDGNYPSQETIDKFFDSFFIGEY